MTFDPLFLLITTVAVVIIGMAKTGLPGAGMLGVAVMALAFPANTRMSVGALLPVLLVADVMAVWQYRYHANWKQLAGIIPYAAVGMVLGYIVLEWAIGTRLKPIIGGLILLLTALDLCRRRFGWDSIGGHPIFAASMCGLSGFGSMVGNAGGPSMLLYLMASKLKPQKFVATSVMFFAILNFAKVIPYAMTGIITRETLWLDLYLVPGMVAGGFLGIWLLPRLSQKLFEVIMLILTAMAGVSLIVN
jgi:uncharacterized protein